MYKIRNDIVQQPLVVRDDDRGFFGCFESVDTFGDDAQSVNIQTAVGFVKNGETRFEHRHLENLVFLLLSSGEPFVDGTVVEFVGQFEHFLFLPHESKKFLRGKRFFSFVRPFLVECGSHEIGHAHAGYFDRILETEEHAGSGPHFRFHGQQILSAQPHFAFRHFIGGIAGKYSAERRFACAVRSHDGMHFAFVDYEINAFQDFLAADGGVQVVYFQQSFRHSGHFFISNG